MEENRDGEERVLVNLRKSRKVFLVEYLCAFILIVLLGLLYSNKISMPSLVFRVVIVIIVGIILFAEISRVYTRYVITPIKAIIISGLFNEQRKNIYFYQLGFVTDLNLSQSFAQRLLNYGTISLSGSQGYDFVLEDVDNPHDVLKMIEDLIETNKNPKAKKR